MANWNKNMYEWDANEDGNRNVVGLREGDRMIGKTQYGEIKGTYLCRSIMWTNHSKIPDSPYQGLGPLSFDERNFPIIKRITKKDIKIRIPIGSIVEG